MLNQRPKKRSLTLRGHRTSVSLEDAFWVEFRQLARQQNRAINELAAEIDEARGTDCGLASAIRLFVLQALQHKLGQQDSPHLLNKLM